MKYLKIVFFVIIFLNISLKADLIKNVILMDGKTICIKTDYYIKDTKLYYFDIQGDKWRSSGSDDYVMTFKSGYIYDTETEECYPDKWVLMGLDAEGYYFLMALIGVIIGGVYMYFSIKLFIMIGSKR